MGKKQWEKKFKVHCGKCHKFINEDEVEFLNIEEGFDGADVETFKCPECGTEQQSKIFG